MRYAFTQEAISLVNRARDVMLRASPIGGGINQETREQFDRSKGFFVEYGIKNLVFVAGLWHQADLGTDWNGEADSVINEYKLLGKAWEKSSFTLKPKGISPEFSRDIDACVEQAMSVAIEFENKLWLAMVVSNALEALEGGIRSFWTTEGLLDEMNEEFKADRNNVEDEIRQILEGNSFFNDLATAYKAQQPDA